jgi:hypothetical protein
MPPIRVYFVFVRVILFTFANAVAAMLTQAMTQNTSVHAYAWIIAACGAVASAVTEAAMAWPKESA